MSRPEAPGEWEHKGFGHYRLKQWPCHVCGHYCIPSDRSNEKCSWCGAAQTEWAFLLKVPEHGPDNRYGLRCPYRRGDVRCDGTFSFPAAAFMVSTCLGGNGPNSYWLDCRFDLQGRCPACHISSFATDLILCNKELLVSSYKAGKTCE